jgi:hypothetical protein
MEKRIGIITFHRASNYGAVLQAYALQRVICGFGAYAEIVDYRGWAVERDHKPSMAFSKYHMPMAILRCLQRFLKAKPFTEFRRNRLMLSDAVTGKDVRKLDGAYDLFVVGSDQVWSETFAGLDSVYRLDFVKESRKASYACSFGPFEFSGETEVSFRRDLSRLETISVREASAKKMLDEHLGLPSRVDVDPTLLLKTDEWRGLAKAPYNGKGYILVYTVQPPETLLDAVRARAKETGLEIVYLNNAYRGNKDLRHVRYATPEEFLGWFDGASYVYTNSFHGTVFSLIFEKDFVVECRTKKKYNNRSKALLQLTGLEGRELTETDAGDSPIDWLDVRARLAAARDDSFAYLRSLCTGKGASLDE